MIATKSWVIDLLKKFKNKAINDGTFGTGSTEWKFLGQTEGNGRLNLPAEWNEIRIQTSWSGKTWNGSVVISFIKPLYEFSLSQGVTNLFSHAGFYNAADNCLMAYAMIDSTTVGLAEWSFAGRSQLNQVSCRIYYR